MKEIEKKAHVPQHRFDEIKQRLIDEYGIPEHVVAEDDYYTMPPVTDHEKPRFRIRKNYNGQTVELQSIVANAKRKQMGSNGLENNDEIEFALHTNKDMNSFVDMMTSFGARYWYHKRKDKWIFVRKAEVEYHLELCTLPIGGREHCFLEIEGVFDPTGLSELEVHQALALIGRRIDGYFAQLGISDGVEERAYRELMGVEYPQN